MIIYKYCSEPFFKDVYTEFVNNLFHIFTGERYIETKNFEEAVQRLVFNVCELSPANEFADRVREFLKFYFFEKPEYRKGVYQQIMYQILPALKKDHGKAVKHEQKMLAFLANEMDKAGRHVEAHVVRTVVKPHLKEMRKDWEKDWEKTGTPVQKYVAAEKKFFK